MPPHNRQKRQKVIANKAPKDGQFDTHEVEELKNDKAQLPKWSQSDVEEKQDDSSLYEINSHKSAQKSFLKVDIPNDTKQAIIDLTENFTKSYRQIMFSDAILKPPINNISRESVQYFIKINKIKVKRHSESHQMDQPDTSDILAGTKRAKSVLSVKKPTKKRQKSTAENYHLEIQEDHSLAQELIMSFCSLQSESKLTILQVITKELKANPDFFSKALDYQVDQLVNQARELFEKRDQNSLQILLNKVSPSASILLHFKVSLTYPQLQEEGSTLAQTFLPRINRVSDFSFLSEKFKFIASRFLASLVKHIIDSECHQIGQGFILFGLQINPSSIKIIFNSGKFKGPLEGALEHLNYPQVAISTICKMPLKFLWPDLLTFWKSKSPQVISDCVDVMSKMNILADPGPLMNKLVDIFAQRSLIVKYLSRADHINIPMASLINILEKIVYLSSESIAQCLSQPADQWNRFSNQLAQKEDEPGSKLELQKVEEMFNIMTQGIEDAPKLDTMLKISTTVSEEVEQFRHCPYQAAIAAVTVSQNSNFTIVVVPTGSGKTWIQGLVARYYCELGLKVAVVEPTEILKSQTAEKLTLVHAHIAVTSIEDFYEEGPKRDVIILDEYDTIVQEWPFVVGQQNINGLWTLKGKKVIAFSATSTPSIERVVSNNITKPTVIKFKSEYEMVSGSSPIQDAIIESVASQDELINKAMDLVFKQFDSKPIIVIHNDDQLELIKMKLVEEKMRFICGSSEEVMAQIRSWDYGVLLLPRSQARGVDTRFIRDALVIIVSTVTSYHELQQMLGRSSRKRGICEGYLFVATIEKSSQVIDRLKKQNVTALQDLESLLILLEKKHKDTTIVKSLAYAITQGQSVKSLKELKSVVGEQHYLKIIKDINF